MGVDPALKTRHGAELVARAVRTAERGRPRGHRGAGDGGPAAGRGGDGLTDGEAEVLELVAQGLTNRQIGDRLFISGKTVSVHVSNLLAKLGVAGRAEAVAVAHRRGLLAG